MTRTESLLTAIACGLACIGCVLLAVHRDRIAAWLAGAGQRVASRVAVEVVRWRTRGYEPHHGDTYLGMHWHEQVVPYAQVNGEPPWVTSPPLRALPSVPDRVDRMVAEFTANLPALDGARVTTASESSGAVTPAAGADGYLYPLEMARAAVAQGGGPTNRSMGNWQPRDTAVDASLLAAIRTEIDGIEYTHQLIDRLFSVIDIGQIFDRALAGVSTS